MAFDCKREQVRKEKGRRERREKQTANGWRIDR